MSKEYWRKRAEEQMKKNHLEADKVIKRAERFITDAEIEIEADIFKWYVRIADNNEIGFEDAKKLLKADELEEFHWTVEQYIKYGKENAINGAWMKELENASAKVHINRLEQAKLEMRQAVEKAYNRIGKDVSNHAKGIFKDTYIRTAFDFQKGIGLGWSFSQIDDKKLAQLISMPWASDGKCFSDRLWTNKTALVENLNKELSMWVLRGDSIQNMTKRLSAKMNVDKKKCARLIRTETTFIAERASLESYKELGVEKVEIIGTLDSTTCELCGDLDGAIVRLTDMEAGITTPPFHPSCRCTTAPYDEEDFIEVRTARNEDGEVYEVPGDMTYREWRKGVVGVSGAVNDIAIAVATEDIDKLQVNSKISNKSNDSELTEAEKEAVLSYISSDSYKINDLLRNNKELGEFQKMMDSLDDALKKLPTYSGNLVRDICFEDFPNKDELTDEFLERFVVGKKISFIEYISTTNNDVYSENPTVRIYIMDAEKGHDIGQYNPEESEVLYERNSEFNVLRKEFVEGIYYIFLGEVK